MADPRLPDDEGVPTAFSLDDVTVTRGAADRHTHPLRAVSTTIAGGRCTVLVGPSGAGKSTLLRLLNRLEEPSSGVVAFEGRPITSYDVLTLRRRVGLVQQRPVLLADTVLDDLWVAVPGLPRDDAAALLHQVGLPGEFLERDTATLSGGEGQRVCLARALALDPHVLLLDEPTSALDEFAAHTVEGILHRLVGRGLTIVMVSHDLRQARRVADDVMVLLGGALADTGPAQRVLTEPAVGARRFIGGVS